MRHFLGCRDVGQSGACVKLGKGDHTDDRPDVLDLHCMHLGLLQRRDRECAIGMAQDGGIGSGVPSDHGKGNGLAGAHNVVKKVVQHLCDEDAAGAMYDLSDRTD